jgi:hypothetical protein
MLENGIHSPLPPHGTVIHDLRIEHFAAEQALVTPEMFLAIELLLEHPLSASWTAHEVLLKNLENLGKINGRHIARLFVRLGAVECFHVFTPARKLV